VFRFDMMVWVALSFSVLFAVSWRVSDGSRNETSVEREGANREANIIDVRNSVICFFRILRILSFLVGGLYLSWAGCRTMLRQGAVSG